MASEVEGFTNAATLVGLLERQQEDIKYRYITSLKMVEFPMKAVNIAQVKTSWHTMKIILFRTPKIVIIVLNWNNLVL